ncbi:TerD family protein [Streptomyces otsuchiensis]|uniref:TerD family protein n=1 Tax=Streptomyces otsuchiensis TaxID=2681388 RepID=UPI001030A490|nr:TerD family protein [Streptomyces otsuchiensis]
MVKGANVALSSLRDQVGSIMVHLSWSSESGDGDADVSVLLLDARGRVRGDADFYFYNNPAAADGSVQLLGKTPTDAGSEDRITLDLAAMPETVDRIAVAASRYGTDRFGELDDLRLRLTDAEGEQLVGFTVTDAEQERAIVFGEFYRRGGEWKFRAVGQGYASGLAGLAGDFGIEVEDDAPDNHPDGLASDHPDEHPDNDAAGSQPGETGDAADSAAAGAPPAAPDKDATRADPDPGTGSEPDGRPTTRRPRTARRKATLPKPRKSLAENDSWRSSRLFPVSSLKSDREREARATSVLLSVMSQVPEFGRRLTAGFGAPAGRMEAFTEVSLPHGDAPRRPDGVIRVERAGKLWTALVETKTNGNPLKPEQVQDYADIATRRGYEAVITLSNDVALEGSPLVEIRTDGRRKHKVALWHLSWAEVTHQAQMLVRHEGVGNTAHYWLLQELLHYLQHDNSGCHGFQNMGPAWVPVRNGIDDETLCPGDPRAVEVVGSWERLIRQVSLRLGGEIGRRVLPVQRTRRGTDPHARRLALADELCTDGRLQAALRVEDAPGPLSLTADFRTARVRTSIEVPAPEQGYPLTWAKRLVRQLADAPADLHVETLLADNQAGPRGTLERLRPEPADLLPSGTAAITGFRLSLFKGMGNTRGTAESSFIRSVDDAVDRFFTSVVLPLERRPARRATVVSGARAEAQPATTG